MTSARWGIGNKERKKKPRSFSKMTERPGKHDSSNCTPRGVHKVFIWASAVFRGWVGGVLCGGVVLNGYDLCVHVDAHCTSAPFHILVTLIPIENWNTVMFLSNFPDLYQGRKTYSVQEKSATDTLH